MMSEANHGAKPEEVIIEWQPAGRSFGVVDAPMSKSNTWGQEHAPSVPFVVVSWWLRGGLHDFFERSHRHG